MNNVNNGQKIFIIPDGTTEIKSNEFSKFFQLEKVIIPSSVTKIGIDAFPKNTILQFNNGIETKELLKLECINSSKLNYNYKLYTLTNDNFYIEQNGNITMISKQYIDVCSNSDEIKDNPALFLDFVNDLIDHNLFIKPLLNGILMKNLSLKSRKKLLEYLDKNDSFFLEVLQVSGILNKSDNFSREILENINLIIEYVEVLKKYNIKDPIWYNKYFISSMSAKSLEDLLTYDYDLITKIINNAFVYDDMGINPWINICIYPNDKLAKNIIQFAELLKKYNQKDKFLFNRILIGLIEHPLLPKLIKYYNKNIKRVLITSGFMEKYNYDEMDHSGFDDIEDLMLLFEIMGCFSDNPIINQKGCNLITEKLFSKIAPDTEKTPFKFLSNNVLLAISNFKSDKHNYYTEFIKFFLENFQKIYEYESNHHPNFLNYIYRNWNMIYIGSTSDKANQHHLKVTLKRCIEYFETQYKIAYSINADLASLLCQFFSIDDVFNTALSILEEAKHAPRNIFTKVYIDENGNPIYDNDPNNDLKEEINENYSFEWLPKQDYQNLVLGKYCDCCAHINGVGQGIMRASMILDNCQNLVIKDEEGIIIAKATLHVNKQRGYAVFNDIPIAQTYKTKDKLQKIYNALIRGTQNFVKVYNQNNINQINQVTIGFKEHTSFDYSPFLVAPEVDINESLDYGTYSLNKSHHHGDWNSKQLLLYTKHHLLKR